MENVFGRALLDYYLNTEPDTLYLHNNYGSVEEMPVEVFFRKPVEFPELEFIALSLCDGKVLDVGAGAGSHALYLQNQGHEVHALEQCRSACMIMESRGLQDVRCGNFFTYEGKGKREDEPNNQGEAQKYDTLLFMMNGVGLAGKLENIPNLLEHCKTLLNPGGQILFDSSDLEYLYKDGSVPRPEGYKGEVGFQYEYKGKKGTPFGWVYVDQDTMGAIARAGGWVMQVLFEDENDQYLARLELRTEDE